MGEKDPQQYPLWCGKGPSQERRVTAWVAATACCHEASQSLLGSSLHLSISSEYICLLLFTCPRCVTSTEMFPTALNVRTLLCTGLPHLGITLPRVHPSYVHHKCLMFRVWTLSCFLLTVSSVVRSLSAVGPLSRSICSSAHSLQLDGQHPIMARRGTLQVQD